jgi:hypothetical protein
VTEQAALSQLREAYRGTGLYEFDLAVERIRAAREAIGNSGVVLVGRAEGFLVGRENIDQVMKRLVAYSEKFRSICSSFASIMLSIIPGAADFTAADLRNGRKIGVFLRLSPAPTN